MRRDKTKYLDDDERDIVEDGEVVRTRLIMKDGRDHRPHFLRVTDTEVRLAQRKARNARQMWIRDMTSAWKTRPKDQAPDDDEDNDPAAPAEAVATQLENWLGKNVTPADVERRRRAQHAEFSRNLENAWRGGR